MAYGIDFAYSFNFSIDRSPRVSAMSSGNGTPNTLVVLDVVWEVPLIFKEERSGSIANVVKAEFRKVCSQEILWYPISDVVFIVTKFN